MSILHAQLIKTPTGNFVVKAHQRDSMNRINTNSGLVFALTDAVSEEVELLMGVAAGHHKNLVEKLIPTDNGVEYARRTAYASLQCDLIGGIQIQIGTKPMIDTVNQEITLVIPGHMGISQWKIGTLGDVLCSTDHQFDYNLYPQAPEDPLPWE